MGSYVGYRGPEGVITGPEPGEGRYRLSRSGIRDLWGLVNDETKLAESERVSLTLALSELEQNRSRENTCR